MAKRDPNPKPSLLHQFWSLVRTATAALSRPPGRSENPDVRFEPSDVNARGVLLTGAGILLVTWLCFGLLYFVFEHLSNIHKQIASIQGASTRAIQYPPEPRLQRSPSRDLRELTSAAEAQLNGYHWLNRRKGALAIPIDRAMDLIVQRGIPPQKTPPNMFYPPKEGSRLTGFEGKVEPEPR